MGFYPRIWPTHRAEQARREAHWVHRSRSCQNHLRPGRGRRDAPRAVRVARLKTHAPHPRRRRFRGHVRRGGRAPGAVRGRGSPSRWQRRRALYSQNDGGRGSRMARLLAGIFLSGPPPQTRAACLPAAIRIAHMVSDLSVWVTLAPCIL